MIYRVDYDSSEETSVDNKEHLLHPLKIIKLNTFTPFRLIILQGELVKNTDRQTEGRTGGGSHIHPVMARKPFQRVLRAINGWLNNFPIWNPSPGLFE